MFQFVACCWNICNIWNGNLVFWAQFPPLSLSLASPFNALNVLIYSLKLLYFLYRPCLRLFVAACYFLHHLTFSKTFFQNQFLRWTFFRSPFSAVQIFTIDSLHQLLAFASTGETLSNVLSVSMYVDTWSHVFVCVISISNSTVFFVCIKYFALESSKH